MRWDSEAEGIGMKLIGFYTFSACHSELGSESAFLFFHLGQ